jgi:hypothetical protein
VTRKKLKNKHMKAISTVIAMLILATASFAQERETIDITTYLPPAGWKKELTEYAVVYSRIDKDNWGQLGIYKSTASKGSVEIDFESEWKELIASHYKITGTSPDNAAEESDGWRIKAGGGKFTFNGSDALAMLITITGYNRCISIVSTANNEVHQGEIEAMLSTLEFIKPEVLQSGGEVLSATGPLTNYLWKSTSNRKDALGNNAGYSTNSYQFFPDGTYKFTNTTLQLYTPKHHMVYEHGSYRIEGNKISLKPIESRFEVRQNEKTDPLLKSGNLDLEEVQYSFEYTTIYDRQRLVLAPTTSTETKRDGSFNFYNNGAMTKSYLYDAEVAPATQPDLSQNTQSANPGNSSIIGTWRRGTGGSIYGGRWSSTGYQYIFNANGTYTYILKTYVEGDPETLLTRESGVFTISGKTVTLDPKTNVIEAWSKPAGFEGYKDLITTQKKPLEKITYEFTLHFFPELKETGLVLLYGSETARDGKYNAGADFPKGWRFSPAGPDNKPIKLPGE